MGKEKWLNKKLCSLHGDKVRVELGPQIIELDCTTKNLSDEVTAPHYQLGKVDAYGKIIDPSKRDKMHCVDWRSKHVPHLWKVYEMQETEDFDKDKKPVSKFIKVAEFENKDEALTSARGLI